MGGAGNDSILVVITVPPDTTEGPALTERLWEAPGAARTAIAREGVPPCDSESVDCPNVAVLSELSVAYSIDQADIPDVDMSLNSRWSQTRSTELRLITCESTGSRGIPTDLELNPYAAANCCCCRHRC